MVTLTGRWSFLAASCCSVEVVKGAAGNRTASFFSTSDIKTKIKEEQFKKEMEEIKHKNDMELKMEERKLDQQKADNELRRIQTESHHKEIMSKMEQQYRDKSEQRNCEFKAKMDQSNKEHEIIMRKMEIEEREREHKRKMEYQILMANIQNHFMNMNFKNGQSLNSNQQGEEKPNNNNSQNMNFSGFQFPFQGPTFGMNNMFGMPFINMGNGMNSMNSEEKRK